MLLCIAYVEISGPGVLSDRQLGDAAPLLDERLLFQPAKYPEGNWQPADLEYDGWPGLESLRSPGECRAGFLCWLQRPLNEKQSG